MEQKQQDTEQFLADTELATDLQKDTKTSETEEKNEDNNSVTILKTEYDELLKAKDSEKKLMYAYAEFENFKRRQRKELEDKVKFANEQLVKQILPVLDNLILAKDHALKTEENTQLKNFVDGIELILKQMTDVLNGFGVELVKTCGEQFDPNFHEALNQVESEEHKNGEVVNEYQKGYTMNGRLIRSAKVSVAKSK